MPIPIRLNSTTGNLQQFATGEELLVDKIDRLAGSGHLVIGDSLGAGEEIKLGTATSDVRVLGDLLVDGSETVSTNETITGTFTANGDVNLGSGDGDTVNLGGGTSDTVNLEANLVLGAGTVDIGSSVTDYLGALWLVAVNDNGPDLAAYNLAASGTNAGAYAIGVDPSLITNSSSTDLMTMLDDLDAAIGASGGETLQETYVIGNTIDVTSANGAVDLSNDTDSDTTTVLSVSRAPTSSTAGTGLDLSMGANTTGTGLAVTAAGSGDAVLINNTGSGDAIDVQDGGSSVLQVTGAGAMNLTPTSGQNLTATVAGAGVIDLNAAGAITLDSTAAGIALTAAGASSFTTSSGNLSLDSAAGELVFDDQGNSGLTLSQAADRTLDQTGTGEVLNGATSVIGAINRLAREIEVQGEQNVELPIENGVTITAGDVVAQSTTTGRVTQANGNAAANYRVIGIAATTGTGDVGGTVVCKVALPGSKVTDSGASFTAGAALFVADGTGRPTSTAPSDTGDLVMRVGYAFDGTSYVIDLGPGVVL